MKNIVLLLVLSLTVLSCGSDHLSESKAKKIIQECLESKPDQKFIILKTGEVLMTLTSDIAKVNMEKYEALSSKGYIKFEESKKKNSIWKEARYYNIELTEKGKPYIYKTSTMTETQVSLKTHQYALDEILEIHETPATNTAKVKVKFVLTEKTPFMTLRLNDSKESYTKILKLKKTNDGWKYCDNN